MPARLTHIASQAKRKRNRIGPAASAQEAAVNLVRTKKFSRKINYGNIAALLADDDDDMVDQSKLRRMASMSVQPRSDNEDDKGYDESGKDDEGENYQGQYGPDALQPPRADSPSSQTTRWTLSKKTTSPLHRLQRPTEKPERKTMPTWTPSCELSERRRTVVTIRTTKKSSLALLLSDDRLRLMSAEKLRIGVDPRLFRRSSWRPRASLDLFA